MCVFLLAILSLSLSSNLLDKKSASTLFGLVLLIGFFGGLVKLVKNREFFNHSGERWLFYGFIVFVLVSLSGVVHSDDVSKAFGKWGRNATLLTLPLLFWVFKENKSNWLAIVVSAFTLTSIVFFAESFYLVEFQNKGRGFSQFNPISLGMFTALCSIILAINFFIDFQLKRIHVLVVALLAVMACVYSQTRGAWLALMTAPVATAWVLGSFRIKLLSLVTFLLVFVGLFVCYKMEWISLLNRGVHDIQQFIDNPSRCTSWGARLAMWKISLVTLDVSPVLGVGYTQWDELAKQAIEQKDVAMTCSVLHQHTAHSIYFHTLATTGLVGLLGLLGLFLVLLICILKAPASNSTKVTPLALLIAYAVFGLSTTWVAKSLHVSVFVVLMAYFMAQCYRIENKQNEVL